MLQCFRLWVWIGLVALLWPPMAYTLEHPQARETPLSTRPYFPDIGTTALNIGRAQVLRDLDIVTQAQLQTSYRPLGLVDRDGRWLRSLVEHQETAVLGVGIGLLGRLQLGIQALGLIHQNANLPGRGLSGVQSSGIGDLQLTGRVLLYRTNALSVALDIAAIAPTATDQAWLGEQGWVTSPRLHFTREAGPSSVSFYFGHQLRQEREFLDIEEGDRLLSGFLAAWNPASLSKWTISAGVTGHLQYRSFGQAYGIGGEAVSGIYYQATRKWQFSIAATSGLTEAATLPAFQGMLGASYRFVLGVHPPDCSGPNPHLEDERCDPPDSDRDGIADPYDQCPEKAEDLDGFADDDGCPDPDNDGDGILDAQDKCPIDAEDKDNFEDEDGCPDLDNDRDGINDEADKCPNDPENMNGLEDEDGCPEADKDNDGIVDSNDKCPEVAEDKDGFEDDDGCPDLDNDKDGIPDTEDVCPDKPENVNGVKDEDGCPDEVLAVQTKTEIKITEEIHFDHGQVVPKKRSRKVLRAVLRILDAQKNLVVRIEGHTDGIGGEAFNLYLSQARAQAIRDYLVRKSRNSAGLDPRLTVEGRGKSAPKTTNKNKAGRADNRRVKFVIINQ